MDEFQPESSSEKTKPGGLFQQLKRNRRNKQEAQEKATKKEMNL